VLRLFYLLRQKSRRGADSHQGKPRKDLGSGGHRRQSKESDGIRESLAKPALGVRDLGGHPGKLSEVQSELDSETANRKMLLMKREKLPSKLIST